MTRISFGATIPNPALIVLLGAAGSGKSTWSKTWPATQVLELDFFRAMVSDQAGDQTATADAVAALRTVLEARLTRKKTTVIDATHSEKALRAGLVQAARRHQVPVIAVVFTTQADECVDRQDSRTPDRAVPRHIVRAQHAAVDAAVPNLHREGFDHVFLANQVHRLEPLLRQASDTLRADLGHDGHAGLGDLLLVRRAFGPEVMPMWRWLDDPQLANGDRVGEISLGPDRLTLALRLDLDGEGDIGFEILTQCPVFTDCTSPAWGPARDVTDLLRAVTGDLMTDPDVYCTDHGPDDPEGRADLEQQYADAVRA